MTDTDPALPLPAKDQLVPRLIVLSRRIIRERATVRATEAAITRLVDALCDGSH